MRVAFYSSHVTRDYAAGRLTIEIQAERLPGVPARSDTVWFTVPPDFHTHNDSVAAALLTLVGAQYRHVTFNFPISRFCADLLAWYYTLDEVGPVDESLEPRQPGRYLALNFSGGLDSTAVWVLLHDLAQVRFKVVTTDYQNTMLDRPGYSSYHRDVTTLTNLRALHYDRHGRFNCAAPLLFADYADLWGVASGHMMNHRPNSFESLQAGQRPQFLTQDATYNAGGLAEVHIVRGMNEPGLLMLLARVAPERIGPALDASDFAGRRKRALKSLTLKYYFDIAGEPVPACLKHIPMPGPGVGRSTDLGVGFRTLWMLKRLDREVMAQIEPKIFETDLSQVADIGTEFYERYNTSISQLLPSELRRRVAHGLHQAGLYPFNERDHADLNAVRRYLESVGLQSAAPSLQRSAPPPDGWSPSAIDTARLEL